MTTPNLRIEKAEREHLPRVVELMRGLAEFEDLLDSFSVTPELLERHLFTDPPAAELLVGYLNDDLQGYAIFLQNFSSFRGRPGMYLEDVYVEPQARGKGLGRALMLQVFAIARDRGIERCDWIVLDWNQRAKQFYDALGAKPLNGWTIYRLEAAAMKALLEG